MINRIFYIFNFLLISTLAFTLTQKGSVDVSNYNFSENDPIDLSGEWIMTLENGDTFYTNVPGDWPTDVNEVQYSLTIRSSKKQNLLLHPSQINSEFILLLNGDKIVETKLSRPLYIPVTLNPGDNLFEFYIKNSTDYFDGIRGKPYIGSYSYVLQHYEINVLQETFFAGSSFIMFVFFIILFLNYKKDRSTLYFSIICLLFSLRGFTTNERIIFNYLPNISNFLITKLEYLSVYTLPLFLLLFIKAYFNGNMYKPIYRVFFYSGLIFPFSAIFLPQIIYSTLIYLYIIHVGIGYIYILIILIIYIKNKYEDSLRIFISLASLATAGVIDIYTIFNSSSDTLFLTTSMIVFILFMSFIVSQREIRKVKKIDRLTEDNIKINNYLSKFVPNEFMKTVGIGDITTAHKGDGVEANLTVLFASIVGFQKELKLHKAEDTVSLLNRCYCVVSPIITKHGGFIDKFIDETLMALFPNKPENALDAMIEISNELKKFNKLHKNEKPLSMRAGIHKGSQFIGVVGDKKRVDATVISKVVNTASRINSFTDKIGRDILISEEIYENINSENYKTMYMGRVKLKGKMNFVGIYSINLGNVEEADNLFSITMKKLQNSSLDKIEDVLINLSRMYRHHTPTRYYLNLIKKNKRLEDLDK